jgi:hypothetical protein
MPGGPETGEGDGGARREPAEARRVGQARGRRNSLKNTKRGSDGGRSWQFR